MNFKFFNIDGSIFYNIEIVSKRTLLIGADNKLVFGMLNALDDFKRVQNPTPRIFFAQLSEDNNIDLSEILMCGDDTLYIISDNVIDALIRQGKLAELNKATCYLLLNYDKAIPDIKASYKDYYRIVQHKEVCCLERQFPNYTKWVSDILYVVCDTHAAFQYFCTRLNHCIHVSDIKDLPKVANDGVIIASGSEIVPVFLDLANKGAKMFLYDGFEELLLSKFDPSRLCDAAVDNTAFYHSIIENRNYCFKYTYMDCDDKLFYVDLIKGLPMCRKPTKDYKETCLELSTAMRRLLRDDIWSRYFQNMSIASRWKLYEKLDILNDYTTIDEWVGREVG